jgi:hypothetical protein
MPSVPKIKKKKLLPLPSLIKKADRIFHKWIRERDAVDLNGKCCTCGKPGTDAGHFVKATHKRVRWNPKNVHLQCRYCNSYLGGNEAEYSKFIIEKYGLETFNLLLSCKGTYKVTRYELNIIIYAYS